jgi:hypothetical protein
MAIAGDYVSPSLSAACSTSLQSGSPQLLEHCDNTILQLGTYEDIESYPAPTPAEDVTAAQELSSRERKSVSADRIGVPRARRHRTTLIRPVAAVEEVPIMNLRPDGWSSSVWTE